MTIIIIIRYVHVLGLVEMTHVDETVDLEFDPIPGLGQEPVPAMLVFVQLQ